MRRSYSSILMQNKHDFPVFHYSDTVEPFLGDEAFPVGAYFVARNIRMDVATIPKGWYGLPAIEYFLEKQYIQRKHITHVMKARLTLPADTFKWWVQ
jgi:hypothetical protein